MLAQLKIQNLVLVERAEIAFGSGLNILTGETGSGKSAILSAIRLIAGERADSQLIGKTGDLAVVEASLSSYSLPEGIDPPPFGEPLWIRREIHRSGRSRCFAEEQQISLATLRQIVGASIELVDQSSSHSLCSLEEQRNMLDAFGDLLGDAKAFAAVFSEEQAQEKRLDELKTAQERRSRDLAWAQEDLAAIEEVNWQSGEEEKISREHQVLIHAQELLEKIESASSALEEAGLRRAASAIEGCVRFDESLAPFSASLKSAALEVEEVRRSLRSYLGRLEADPGRLAAAEQRIAAIEQIKRRFGKTLPEVEEKKKEILLQIDRLAHLDDELSSLSESLKSLKGKTHALSQALTGRRKEAAKTFSRQILEELKSLNLPHAKFEISLEPKPLCSHGADSIRFLFSANPGHSPIPLEDCASGGELSRLLLAIKTVLAQKEKSACLVFDEIDSNVGGQTASVLGEKLRAIAESKQVICVTHFVQVAKSALHHFAVSKGEKEGLAVTSICKLSALEREKEYRRMLGAIP